MEGVHSRFQVCKNYLKSVEIFQSYDHKCTATYIYDSQCT